MKKLRVPPSWMTIVFLMLALLQVRCTPVTAPSAAAPAPVATGSSDAPAAAPTATPVPLKLLKTSPEKGPGGTAFTVSGEGFAPGAEITLQWVTWDGAYVTEASSENIRFTERQFAEKRVVLGRAVADAKGRMTASLTAPEDFGETHDIYAVVGGQDVAKGGFRILRTATISPTEGPVGTPITIVMKGISVKAYENTMGVLWDNKYTGFMTAVTTRGTAVAQIRAAGPPGKHALELKGAAATVPYLNVLQSPVAHIAFDWRWTFTVTKDAGPPPNTLDWPERSRVAAVGGAAPRTTASGVLAAPGLSAMLDPVSGPILSKTTLQASGLPAKAEVELFWVTARGNRVSPSGWSLQETSLLKTTTGADGSVQATVQIPDDLGGWHVVKLMQGEKVLTEIPYYVERSLASVTPRRVKAGEPFTVQVKGIGWTELDNGFAVTYDNAYIGYACGFNSNGDVTMTLVATGEPGTHLIDLYPMIYKGKNSAPPWNYEMPFLTSAQDFPGLDLGYKLPIFRLAIEIVE